VKCKILKDDMLNAVPLEGQYTIDDILYAMYGGVPPTALHQLSINTKGPSASYSIDFQLQALCPHCRLKSNKEIFVWAKAETGGASLTADRYLDDKVAHVA